MLPPVRVVRMNRTIAISIIFGITVLLSLSLGADASNRPTAAELAAITTRGRMLAGYDTAAWQATDAVMATHPKTPSSGRYIAHLTETGWVVDFGRLNGAEDKFLVDYEATQEGPRFRVTSFNPEREDTGWNLAAAKGIATATKDFGRTDRPYNVAAFPKQSGGMYVYLYPAQVKAGVYPLGADIRYQLSSDGTRILEKRPLHRTIIEYAAPVGTSEKETGGYHTHVLSDVPEDTDVFLVLTRKPRVPEFVGAGPYMYTIAIDGRITIEDRPPAQ